MKYKTFPFRNNPDQKGLVSPYNKNLKPLPKTGIICAVKKDLDLLKQNLCVKGGGFGFLMSHIYKAENFTLAGPYFGSPYAAAIVETLADSGVTKIIAIGWCGSLSKDLNAGDILIPNALESDDFTYQSYINNDEEIHFNSNFSHEIKNYLKSSNINFKEGKIWTTGAIYRETQEKVKYFKCADALAVEMENSAVLSAAAYLNIDAVCINIVSDELKNDKWKPCFSSKAFKESRINLIDRIAQYVGS